MNTPEAVPHEKWLTARKGLLAAKTLHARPRRGEHHLQVAAAHGPGGIARGAGTSP